MTFTAYALARSIWDNTPLPDADGSNVPELKFCIGGINTYNGFPIHIYKNEIEVYNSIVKEIVSQKTNLIDDFLAIIADANSSASATIASLGACEAYIDMNGSMAFYKPDMFCKMMVQAVSIMGGMETTDMACPMTTNNFINRPSCTTFNQLYHAQGTNDFINDMQKQNVDIYFVTNQECNRVVGYNSLVKLIEPPAELTTGANAMMLDAMVSCGVFSAKGNLDYNAYTAFLAVQGAAPTVFDLLSGAFLVARILNKTPAPFSVHPAKLIMNTTDGVIDKFVVDNNAWPSPHMYTARVLPGVSALDANKAFIGMITPWVNTKWND